jgi:uncharacterized protein (TIRG00374 family)
MFSFLGRIGLSIGLLWFIFSKIDIQGTREILRSADLTYIFIAAVIFILTNFILLLRWFVFIKALDLSVKAKAVIVNYFYGLFGNLFLPTAIGGDLVKVIGLCKDSDQRPKVVASVLIDRLSGFASIALVSVVAFVGGHRLIGDDTLAVPIILMGTGALLVAAVLFNEKIYSFVCRAFDRLPRFKNALMTIHYDIALLKRSRKYKEGIKGVLLSCLSQVIFASTYYFTAKALHQEIALIYFLIFVPIICVASAFPSIGGLGAREVGAVYLFSKIGIGSGIAVSLSLINFLFMVIVGLAGGVIYVYTLSVGRVQRDSSIAAGIKPSEA